MIRPWQAWCYSLSLAVAAVTFYGFCVSMLMYKVSGWHVPVLSQLPPSHEAELPLYLAMGTTFGAILMLAMLTFRIAAFPLNSDSSIVVLRTRWSALNNILWVLALVATIPCLMIYLLSSAPIYQLLSPWGAFAAMDSMGIEWLAALSPLFLLYDVVYIINTNERKFIEKAGWHTATQRIALIAGRLAFYLVHPLLGFFYLLMTFADWANRRKDEEALA